MGLIIATLSLPVLGKMSDVVTAKIIFPLAFLMRSIVMSLFYSINDPRTIYAASLLVSVFLFSNIQYICVQAYFMRNLPSHIRGIMISALWFFASVGATIFALIGGIMFDKLGACSPFLLVSTCDFSVFVFAIVLVCAGKINE